MRRTGDTPTMRIAWAIPCRYAEISAEGQGTFLGAGVDVMRTERVPTTVTAALAVNVLVPEHQLGQQGTISVEVLDPRMRVAVGPSVDVLLNDYEHRPEGRRPSVMAVITLEFKAPQYGQYTINLRLADRVTSVPIFVVAAQHGTS
jgi:hypothetical protein